MAIVATHDGGSALGAGSLGLEVAGLGKRYGDVTALDGCSLTVRPGRVVGLLGPNGAGKTTTMRCIFGLVEPDRGEVRWCGAPIDREARLRFGYMPEERGLYPHMRVRAQLEYLARLSGLDRRAAADGVDRWLARLGLQERGEARLDALSHGNQQRVQLAAALVHDPVALVLDEPFAGLDPLGVEALSEVIRDLALGGTAVLFSSHQLDLVEDVCQDVVVIDHGRVVLDGELERLRAASSRRYLAVGFRGTEPLGPDGRACSRPHGRARSHPARAHRRRGARDARRARAVGRRPDAVQPRAPGAVGSVPRGGRTMTRGRRSIVLVAWREISERTSGRAFMISTIAIVAVVLAGVILPALNDRTTRVQAGITGATPAALAPALRDAARARSTPSWSCAAIRPSRRARPRCATERRTC